MLTIIQDRIPQNAALWAVCDKLGCKLAVKEIRAYEEVYGLVGNTFAHKDAIKSAGFRFDGQAKVWWAPNEQAFAALEA